VRVETRYVIPCSIRWRINAGTADPERVERVIATSKQFQREARLLPRELLGPYAELLP
jgi:hypothetical protein